MIKLFWYYLAQFDWEWDKIQFWCSAASRNSFNCPRPETFLTLPLHFLFKYNKSNQFSFLVSEDTYFGSMIRPGQDLPAKYKYQWLNNRMLWDNSTVTHLSVRGHVQDVPFVWNHKWQTLSFMILLCSQQLLSFKPDTLHFPSDFKRPTEPAWPCFCQSEVGVLKASSSFSAGSCGAPTSFEGAEFHNYMRKMYNFLSLAIKARVFRLDEVRLD